jgi:citrate lyase subunit beta/citryl-CoA lyase
MLSAHNIKHLNKIPSLQADCIMLNLEDGVHEDDKAYALNLAAIALQHAPKEQYIAVRINPLDEGGRQEIELLNSIGPDAIRIPKIQTPQEVEYAASIIARGIDIHLSIETADAFYAIREFSHPRVRTMHLGILDLLHDLGLPQTLLNENNPTIDAILTRFLLEVKSIKKEPVGFIYQYHKEVENFRSWCLYEKSMGYSAKGCITPKQAEIANQVFGVDADSLQKAKEIKKLYEQKAKDGIAGFGHPDYGFIDGPVYKDACALLQNRSRREN